MELRRGENSGQAPAWHIVTGEYPPARGGVADYSRSVARALAAAGDEVHVWAPDPHSGLVRDSGVNLHPLARGFRPTSLMALSRAFEAQRRPRRLLLQYVAQAFGLGGMNVPFCAWVASLRDTEVWVMFHEVKVKWPSWWRPRTAVMSIATHAMAALLAHRADRTFVSTPSWEPMLRRLAPGRPRPAWTPVPSNVQTAVPPESRSRVRDKLRLAPGAPLIGHFGTYGPLLTPLLTRAATTLLARDSSRTLLLLGRGGKDFARALAQGAPVCDRVLATGDLDADALAEHLVACDFLLQPYADGVTTRRATVMAALALGMPVATNEGYLTEPFWRMNGAVELAATADSIAEAGEQLIRDPQRAAAIGERGQRLYRTRFSLEHTIRALRA